MLNHKDWDYIFDVMAYKKGAGERYAKALLQVKSKFSIVNLFIGHFNSFNQQIAFSYFNPSKLLYDDFSCADDFYIRYGRILKIFFDDSQILKKVVVNTP